MADDTIRYLLFAICYLPELYRSFEPKLFLDQFAETVFDFRMTGKAQAPRNGTPDVVIPCL